ncbi:MAG: hypothetical protein ACI4HL_00985 [Ruminococcus sp.]
MKISNFKTSDKLFSIILTVLLLYGSVAFTSGLIFEEFDFPTLILSISFCVGTVIFLIVDMIVFSSKTILNENGLLYRTIIKKRFYNWDEIKFVSSYHITFYHKSAKGIICSIDLEREEIEYNHLRKGTYIDHYICFPYSEEAENYLLSTLPSDKYLGLAYTDENFK